MRSRAALWFALWAVAATWAGAFAPTQADQAPSPFPSPSPTPPSSGGATPASTASPGAGPLSNPFPSASPTVPVVGGNGYVAAGFMVGNASGGQVAPQPNTTSTPYAFPSSGAGGFWIDLLGRIAPSYLASISYENLNLHGGDNPLVSYAQGRVLYQPRSSHMAAGIGLVSIQRSTSTVNMNAFGLGFSLLPDFSGGITPYGSVFVYPHVQTSGTGATFTSLDAGALYVPKGRGGFFVRAGGSLRTGLPAITSPGSLTALQVGIGTSF